MFGNTREHFGADLNALVEGEDKIRIAWTGKDSVGAGLALDLPANRKEGCENLAALRRAPLAHAARLKTAALS